jgi:hypothetical protein
MPASPHFRRPRPVVICCAVFGSAAVCLALAGPVVFYRSGGIGFEAAALAIGCCCIGALGTLCVAPWLRAPHHLLASVLVGMAVRMGVALAAAVVVQLRGGPLVEVGFVYYLLMFYLVTLAVETAVVVRS